MPILKLTAFSRNFKIFGVPILKSWKGGKGGGGKNEKSDRILDRIYDIIGEKVRVQFDAQELEELEKSAAKRFGLKIPPGYKDQRKDGVTFYQGHAIQEKYSDYIIWREIIEISKSSGKDIILVTDDAKDDWWWVVRGKTIGARPELVEEFFRETGGRKIKFYQGFRFFEISQKRSGKPEDIGAIDHIRSVSERHFRERRYPRELIEYAKLNIIKYYASSDAVGIIQHLGRGGYLDFELIGSRSQKKVGLVLRFVNSVSGLLVLENLASRALVDDRCEGIIIALFVSERISDEVMYRRVSNFYKAQRVDNLAVMVWRIPKPDLGANEFGDILSLSPTLTFGPGIEDMMSD